MTITKKDKMILPFVVLDKAVGQTPLEAAEAWRVTQPELQGVPLAYAGRLDPMASGQLLVLIGEECKKQDEYHDLDKEYQVAMLFGVASDSGDVLGLIQESGPMTVTEESVAAVFASLVGEITMPYPIFSAKTVAGKPLHTWTMENRLDEITIPTRTSHLYSLTLDNIYTLTRAEVAERSLEKIALLPPVTDPRKSLGNDFRRPEVHKTWETFKHTGSLTDVFYIANCTCVSSSGTYMRSLTEVAAKMLGTTGLAYGIHRSKIGHFNAMSNTWSTLFT
jgi:tRNA pseudouridine(55) synthase